MCVPEFYVIGVSALKITHYKDEREKTLSLLSSGKLLSEEGSILKKIIS